MSNILYAGISSDGFISDDHDETPWSEEEWAAFQSFVESCDYVLLGRRTFEIMNHDDFAEGPEYIVVTTNPALDTGGLRTLNIQSPADLKLRGRIGIIGGGELNGRLAKLGLIDEIILDIEPIQLHKGIRLFGSHEVPLTLELLSSRRLNDKTVQRRYEVQ